MSPVSLEDAKARLGEIIESLRGGEEVVITKDDRPVAKLIAEPPAPRRPRQPGSAVDRTDDVPKEPSKPRPKFGSGAGKLIIISEDEDHLKDFEEYMS